MGSKRLGYIDIAKGIAMAFIIIGHMGIVYSADTIAGGMPSRIVSFAFTFHLPVFLILSGYFFREDTRLSMRLVKKDARSLLLPYAVTSGLIVGGCTLLAHVHGLERKAELVRWLQAALWGAGGRIPGALWDVERIGGIWFLLALFWAHLLIASTCRLPPWSRLLTLAICTCVASISARYVWLPWSIQSGLGCALYLYVGMLIRRADGFSKRQPILFVLVLAIAWGYVIVLRGGGSLASQHYDLGAATVLGGIAATVLIVLGCRLVEGHAPHVSRFMQWIGRNTLPILCVHILEDDVLWWWQIGTWFTGVTGGWQWTWVLVTLLRFLVDAALVGVLYVVPVTRMVFFPKTGIKRPDACMFREKRLHFSRNGNALPRLAMPAKGVDRESGCDGAAEDSEKQYSKIHGDTSNRLE
jgi:fucose 4-O-acetylase-like acetyltransferase